MPPVGGTVLLCGSADCVKDDYTAARSRRPQAQVWAVNEAFYAVRAQNIVTQHQEQAARMRRSYVKLYGTEPVIHAATPRDGVQPGEGVDVWWGLDEFVGGSSGIWGALLCSTLFNEVILCGIPLSGGRYHQSVRADTFVARGERTWTGSHGAVERYQDHVKRYVADGLLSNVRSMSGFTRDVLGGLE